MGSGSGVLLVLCMLGLYFILSSFLFFAGCVVAGGEVLAVVRCVVDWGWGWGWGLCDVCIYFSLCGEMTG